MIDKSLDYMPVALAVLKCGAAYTPIIQDLPDERAKYMIENAGSKLIVTTKQFYRKFRLRHTRISTRRQFSSSDFQTLRLYINPYQCKTSFV